MPSISDKMSKIDANKKADFERFLDATTTRFMISLIPPQPSQTL